MGRQCEPGVRQAPGIVLEAPAERGMQAFAEARDRLPFAAKPLARVQQAKPGAIHALRKPLDPTLERALQARLQGRKLGTRGVPAGARQFGSAGRRRRAQIGGEIGDGEVGFVADAGHDGYRAGAKRAGEALVVERPQVLEAAAAAHDQKQIDAVAYRTAPCISNRVGDTRPRLSALNGDRIEYHRKVRRTPGQGHQDVAQSGGLGRGDHTDGAREARQRSATRGIEQALCGELRLELVEGLEQVSDAGRAQRLDIELVVAARLVERHERARFDPHAIFGPERDQLGAAAPHRATHLRVRILEGEVQVSRSRPHEVGYLSAHPQQGQGRLEALACETVERRNAQHR